MYKRQAIEHAKANQQNVVLIDTAGRLHVDEDMMQELADIKANIQVDATILIVCLLYTSIIYITMQDNLCTVTLCSLNLDQRSCGRHNDHCLHTIFMRSIGNTLCMISGRCCDPVSYTHLSVEADLQ